MEDDKILVEVTGKELHLLKILRSIIFGEAVITLQNGEYIIVSVTQKIKLEKERKKHITMRDERNIGLNPDVLNE